MIWHHWCTACTKYERKGNKLAKMVLCVCAMQKIENVHYVRYTWWWCLYSNHNVRKKKRRRKRQHQSIRVEIVRFCKCIAVIFWGIYTYTTIKLFSINHLNFSPRTVYTAYILWFFFCFHFFSSTFWFFASNDFAAVASVLYTFSLLVAVHEKFRHSHHSVYTTYTSYLYYNEAILQQSVACVTIMLVAFIHSRKIWNRHYLNVIVSAVGVWVHRWCSEYDINSPTVCTSRWEFFFLSLPPSILWLLFNINIIIIFVYVIVVLLHLQSNAYIYAYVCECVFFISMPSNCK